MSSQLTETQNAVLGTVAAFLEAIMLQPTIYWKNARAMNMPFTLDPRIVYRGTAACIFNEMQMMGLQFAVTGYIQKLFATPDGKMTRSATFNSAILGGALTAFATGPVETIMIQQQRFSGNFFATPVRIVRQFGLGSKGLFRGMIPTVGRDSIYVAGMLGVTPIVQQYLMESHGYTLAPASLIASITGGVMGAWITHPMDVIKTCMQGDLERVNFGSLVHTAKTVFADGGLRRFYNGVFWRTVNIVGTVYVANECCNRLPKYLFNIPQPAAQL